MVAWPGCDGVKLAFVLLGFLYLMLSSWMFFGTKQQF
jgi:hypothetical protein